MRNKYKADKTKGDAIIAVDEGSYGHMIMMLTNEYWKLEAHDSYDPLPEIEFVDALPGLYYANMSGSSCGGDRCLGYPCAGDCFETDWEIVKPLFIISENK